MAAEDSLIKYARDEGTGGANWNPALHPRTGTPPNPGWFAPTELDSSRVRVGENQLDSHRTDAAPATDGERTKLAPDYSIDQRADADPSGLKDKPHGSEFWSDVRTAVSNWLQESTANQLRAYLANPASGSRFLGTAVHKATARLLEIRYPNRFIYRIVGPDFLDTTTGKFIELTTPRQTAVHLARPGYSGVTISTYTLP
jgi:hypothetical protein